MQQYQRDGIILQFLTYKTMGKDAELLEAAQAGKTELIDRLLAKGSTVVSRHVLLLLWVHSACSEFEVVYSLSLSAHNLMKIDVN